MMPRDMKPWLDRREARNCHEDMTRLQWITCTIAAAAMVGGLFLYIHAIAWVATWLNGG